MARNPAASPPTNGRPPRRSRALALLLLLQALPGCETLERMDYWDRLFDPTLRTGSTGALRTGPVAAMEPVQNPADDPPPASAWDAQPAPVVAMEPVWNPADRAPQQQASLRTAEPRPGPPPVGTDAEARTRSLVRQNPWLTRFWMELTPAQRARVERQLQRGDARLAGGERTEPAAVWDPMGLSDRAKLVFGGGGPPAERPAPAERRDEAAWASSPQ